MDQLFCCFVCLFILFVKYSLTLNLMPATGFKRAVTGATTTGKVEECSKRVWSCSSEAEWFRLWLNMEKFELRRELILYLNKV